MSFEEFASGQLRQLLGLAIALCADVPTAEDLVQDVLLKVHKHWGRIEKVDDPAAYVRRMLVNENISSHRKWSRIIPSAVVTDDRLVADFAGVIAQRDLLTRLILELPRQQQTVLTLRYYAGLSDIEIAETMGCTPGTVRGYASRAIAHLRLHDELTRDYIGLGGAR